MGEKIAKCRDHKFQVINGSCSWGDHLSYEGKCGICGIEMSMFGKVDDKGNGEATIFSGDNKNGIRKIIKNGNLI